MARGKLVKLHNPHLMAVNPFGKTTRRRRVAKRRATASQRGKKRNPSLRRNGSGEIVNMLMDGLAAGSGAALNVFIANMLPLPINPLANAGTKFAVGVGIGFLASKVGPFKQYAKLIGAGAAGVGVIDGVRFIFPKLRTVIVPSEPQAQAVKEIAPGELNDVVVADGFGDVVDTMNYDSAWAAN